MHLNIEKLSFISFLVTALEMKGKRVERPVLVKRSQNADICIPLKIKCIAFVIVTSIFDISSFSSPLCSVFSCAVGKTAPVSIGTDYFHVHLILRGTSEKDIYSAELFTRKIREEANLLLEEKLMNNK